MTKGMGLILFAFFMLDMIPTHGNAWALGLVVMLF